MKSARFRVTGQVQGVGFRYYARRLARDCGVVGWVRNEPDGAVLAEASGSPEALVAFSAGLRMGPPAARVERVDEIPLPEATPRERFEII